MADPMRRCQQPLRIEDVPTANLAYCIDATYHCRSGEIGTRQVIARFEAERQALALMDHPSIAKVLDAGAYDPCGAQTPDTPPLPEPPGGCPIEPGTVPCLVSSSARPYFVMELVRGVPVTEYCDHCSLTTRERLELFVLVCQAVLD